MEKSEISIQLYTARKFEPYKNILNFCSQSGITNIELFGLESIDVDEFKTIMGSANISSRSAHVSFEALKDI